MMLSSLVLGGFALALAAPGLHRVSRGASGWLLALYPLAAALLAASQIASLGSGGALRESLAWAPSLGLRLSFSLDGLSLLFLLLIGGIGALVMVYAGGYLRGYAHLGRFYAFLLAFMASMLGLVLADNVLALFVFWEGTSVASFLLIGFSHRSEAARKSALQALVVTGGGGLALLAGLILLAIAGGSWEVSELATRGDVLRAHALYTPAVLLILAGAFTKSALFPFHFWLPNAMEAPTPVSAYLHSATMVKAGIYLMARLSPALGGTELWNGALTLFGGATMLIGGALALLQSDLKKLLAYSTISALGALTLLLGLGTEASATAFVVFLLAHALYKGALFMIAGTVDHETGTRDVEKLGGLRHAMPVTFAVAVLAGLSLSGAGPLLSFVAKEMLFEAVLEAEKWRALLIAVALISGALFVAVAAIVVLKPFLGERRETPKEPHEAPASLWLGPAVLAPLGLLLGLFPKAAQVLAEPAASAVAGKSVEVKLSLWHGFNVALGLSAASLALGAAAFVAWPSLRRAAGRAEARAQSSDKRWRGTWGPARVYEAGMSGLEWFASAQTRALQNGYLRAYVATVVVTATLLVGWTLMTREGLPAILVQPLSEWDAHFYEVAIAAVLLLAGFATVQADSRLAALACLGVVGYCVSLVYLLFGAPDLAMTQVLVDTLSVILFVLVFYHLPRFASLSNHWVRARDAMISLFAGALMTVLVMVNNAISLHPTISTYFIEQSLPKGYGRNIVNVMLVDFRAFDTLGEICVLALAGIGVFSLLKLRSRREIERGQGQPGKLANTAKNDAVAAQESRST